MIALSALLALSAVCVAAEFMRYICRVAEEEALMAINSPAPAPENNRNNQAVSQRSWVNEGCF